MSRTLDPKSWAGSFNGKESGLQQLAPYVGKMKSGMAKALVEEFSARQETVLDPFCGSGVVPFEAACMGRNVVANDLNPYAYVLTLGKLFPPRSMKDAIVRAKQYLAQGERITSLNQHRQEIPEWVVSFFHPRTLSETLATTRLLMMDRQFFLLGCLLGILHHQRPGFLSYPASHQIPYLRSEKFPRSRFPDLYRYRDLRSRLLSKIERAYRRAPDLGLFEGLRRTVLNANTNSLPLWDGEVDAIITSPPYLGTLDYGRDNRLRLWFLGVEDYDGLDGRLSLKEPEYSREMTECLREMNRVLKPGGRCVLVLGNVRSAGRTRKTADIIAGISERVRSRDQTGREYTWQKLASWEDVIPEERRQRRGATTTTIDTILVLRKAQAVSA